MASTLYYKRNDTSPSIAFNVARSGAAVDLTGATVKFKIMNSSLIPVNPSTNTCTIVSATGGSVRYDPTATDFATTDTYNGEIEITYASGKIETWPNNQYVTLVVTADV